MTNILNPENEQKVKEYIRMFGERAVKEFQGETVEGLTPKKVDNYLSMLSAYSAQLEEVLGNLEMKKATDYPKFRTEYKTNVDASMFWDSTPEGLEMIKLKRLLKAVDKIISACKNRLRRMDNEANNKY